MGEELAAEANLALTILMIVLPAAFITGIVWEWILNRREKRRVRRILFGETETKL